MVKFEWDGNKAEATWRELRISFAEATTVFSDPNCIYELDDYELEERQRALGMSRNMLLLLVVHTEREKDGREIIRIISARKATPTERKRYHGNHKF